MSFREIIDSVNGSRNTITLFNVDAPPRAVEQVANYLEPQQVRFVSDTSEKGRPTNFVVLHDDGEFVAASDFRDVYSHVDIETGLHTATELGEFEYPDVLRHVDDTTFSEFGKRRMIIASREIEKRAWDVGDGQLHTGFQRLSLVESQHRIYRKLGESEVETHVYGVSDAAVSDAIDVNVHGIDSDEIARSWFVLFDGDGDDREKCGLLAQEVGENVYSGFWTYRAGLVDEMLAHLTATHRSR
ncbi:DICT sensory domain-containing protein [Halorientalis brevis]|uniref:DICT sensory domain-containing protein n=1 Tax=Halorientalis brevis TaxID=1126241 RepID=A0ABD6CDP6_9EURY|nr:DICT sensory domain-containing protein [Halorientalis brevis]